MYQYYREPILDFRSSMEDIKSLEKRELKNTLTNALIYSGENNWLKDIVYGFSENRISFIHTTHSILAYQEIISFIGERYILILVEDAGFGFISPMEDIFVAVVVDNSSHEIVVSYSDAKK